MSTPPLPFHLQGEPAQKFDWSPSALAAAPDMQLLLDNAANDIQLPFDRHYQTAAERALQLPSDNGNPMDHPFPALSRLLDPITGLQSTTDAG